jgi:hypothetical protein
MFPCPCFAEEGVEGIVTTANGFIRRHLTVWLDSMLEAEKLPARIPNLNARLADMDADALTHGCFS